MIPASPELMRLYADYLNREYGALDSDYMFVNLRLRERTGIDFEPHQYRHTYATWLLRRGAGMESVKELLGHASITTNDHYDDPAPDPPEKAGQHHLTGIKDRLLRNTAITLHRQNGATGIQPALRASNRRPERLLNLLPETT